MIHKFELTPSGHRYIYTLVIYQLRLKLTPLKCRQGLTTSNMINHNELTHYEWGGYHPNVSKEQSYRVGPE